MTATFSIFLPNQENFPTTSSSKLHLCVHQKDWVMNRKEWDPMQQESHSGWSQSSVIFRNFSERKLGATLSQARYGPHMLFFSFHHHPRKWASLHSQVYAKGTQMFFDPKSTYILLQYTVPLIKLYRHSQLWDVTFDDTSSYDRLFFSFFFSWKRGCPLHWPVSNLRAV